MRQSRSRGIETNQLWLGPVALASSGADSSRQLFCQRREGKFKAKRNGRIHPSIAISRPVYATGAISVAGLSFSDPCSVAVRGRPRRGGTRRLRGGGAIGRGGRSVGEVRGAEMLLRRRCRGSPRSTCLLRRWVFSFGPESYGSCLARRASSGLGGTACAGGDVARVHAGGGESKRYAG